jgi:biopolymer transport protein ExbB/TolQ
VRHVVGWLVVVVGGVGGARSTMTHPVFLFSCLLLFFVVMGGFAYGYVGGVCRIKMRADQLEAWELEKLRNSTQQGMYSKEAQFRRRQTNELLALQKRIQAGRDEQKKLRQRDLECLLQRYQNVKSELETAQNLERIRMDRYAGQTAATMGIVGNKAKRLKEAARNR